MTTRATLLEAKRELVNAHYHAKDWQAESHIRAAIQRIDRVLASLDPPPVIATDDTSLTMHCLTCDATLPFAEGPRACPACAGVSFSIFGLV